MKLKIGFGKAALLGIVCLSVAFCNTGSIKEVSAATPGNSSAVPVSTQNSGPYPIHDASSGNDLYGFIDETGSVVIKPAYTRAENFSEGLAVVNQNDICQVINTKGEVIFKSSNYIDSFHNGMAAFTDNKTFLSGYINTKGKVAIKASYDYTGNFGADHTALVSKAGKFYRINREGKILKTYSLKTANCYPVPGGDYVTYTDSKTFLTGVKDLNGKTILKANYSEVTYLGNGLFGVKKKLPQEKGYLTNVEPYALFSTSGKQLTSYKYYDLSNYSNHYASYTDSKYTYLIDTKGSKVSSFPRQSGRGTLTVLGNVVQANIDGSLYYLKMDGTLIWKAPEAAKLSSAITVHSVKVKPNKYVTVYYPKLEGLSDLNVQKKINDNLKNLFTADRMTLTEKDELMVEDNFSANLLGDLLIIGKTGYDYPFGAAHGTPILLYYFIDTRTGASYQFKDLFKKDSNYIKTLENIVLKKMKEQEKNGESIYFPSGGSYVTENQFFDLSNDTLTIYFDSSSIAPYAAGFPEFKIPLSDIKNIINKDGAFWKSFHK